MRHYGAAFLIISGRQDRQEAEALAGRMAGPTLVTGGPFPCSSGGLLSHCRLFVGNDSGPLHMALALGVPSIALLGADHPRRIGPYQVDWGAFLRKKEEVCAGGPVPLPEMSPERLSAGHYRGPSDGNYKDWWEPEFRCRQDRGGRERCPAD